MLIEAEALIALGVKPKDWLTRRLRKSAEVVVARVGATQGFGAGPRARAVTPPYTIIDLPPLDMNAVYAEDETINRWQLDYIVKF